MNLAPHHAAVLEALRDHAGPKTVWLAGTRGEALCLGPYYTALRAAGCAPGLWLATSEQGMALHQALDWLGIIPHETAPLCHPAEEPAQRLAALLARAEAFGRQRHATRFVFSGWGPTAVGAALFAQTKGGGGVWLRPPDPLGLVPHLPWEAGNERIIRACTPAVQEIGLPGLPWLAQEPAATGAAAPEAAPEAELAGQFPGLRPGHPRVLLALMRREWGLTADRFTRLARRAADWARADTATDYVLLSALNARLERPFRSIQDRPGNLHLAAPLPQPMYRELLLGSTHVVTDSPLMAAEAQGAGVATSGIIEAPQGATALLPFDELLAGPPPGRAG